MPLPDTAGPALDSEPGAADRLPPPIAYRIDPTRVTMRELRMENPILALPGWVIIRLAAKSLPPASTDDLPVEALGPYRVDASSLPSDIRGLLERGAADLAALGFHDPVYHAVNDLLHRTDTYMATFAHRSRPVVARLHLRMWGIKMPPRPKFFVEFFTELDGGTYLWSLSGKPDMLAPESCTIQRSVTATPAELWALHERGLATITRRPTPIPDSAAALAVAERLHAKVRDFHVARGVFAPATAADFERVGGSLQAPRPAGSPAAVGAAVLAEVERLQRGRGGWRTTITLLVISVILFLLIGIRGVSWSIVLALVPILFIHECGHYLAMKAFGYRDLRMFFIPAFGAAVTGRHYNVAGWKKAVVSLMGPVPGIALGIIVGLCGLVWASDPAVKAGLLLLAINGFNLLPMLPLDGGHVVHTVLFSRHPGLDVAFRACAALAVAGLAILAGSQIFITIAVLMFISLPATLRVSRIAAQLRAEGLRAASEDDQTIPPAIAERIIARLLGPARRPQHTRAVAQQTLQVFEALNARPPGIAASIGLLGVHALSFVAAAVFSLIFLFGRGGPLQGLARAAADRPAYAITDPAALASAAADADAVSQGPRLMVVATLATPDLARAAYEEAAAALAAGERATLFASTLFIQLPADDEAARRRWLNWLEQRASGVYVESGSVRGAFRFQAVARTPAEAAAMRAELLEYFALPLEHAIVAPWSPAGLLTDDQRLARRTYARIMDAADVWDDPQLEALDEEIDRSRRQGDKAARAALIEKHRSLFREIQRRRVLALADDPSLHRELVLRYVDLPSDPDPKAFFPADMSPLAPLLGPTPPGDTTNALSGHVVTAGPELDFYYVTFADPPVGAAALARWLADHGCIGLRYEITPEPVFDADESADEPD